jgi:hypothetical protein
MALKVVHRGGCGGAFWLVGWLFTVGYCKLAFWPGALAFLIWPYHLGGAAALLTK